MLSMLSLFAFHFLQEIGGISRGKDNDYKQFMSADCHVETGGDTRCSLKEQGKC